MSTTVLVVVEELVIISGWFLEGTGVPGRLCLGCCAWVGTRWAAKSGPCWPKPSTHARRWHAVPIIMTRGYDRLSKRKGKWRLKVCIFLVKERGQRAERSSGCVRDEKTKKKLAQCRSCAGFVKMKQEKHLK